jgi:hypothetical protein
MSHNTPDTLLKLAAELNKLGGELSSVGGKLAQAAKALERRGGGLMCRYVLLSPPLMKRDL